MFTRILILVLALLSTAGSFGIAYAADNNSLPASTATPQLTNTSHQLSIEKTRNSLLANKLAALRQQTSKPQLVVTPALLTKTELMISLAKTDLDGVNQNLANAQAELTETENTISALNQQMHSGTANDMQAELQAQLLDQKNLLALRHERVKVLEETKNIATQALQIAQEWYAKLQALYQQQERQTREQALEELTANLQREQQDWLDRLAQLNQQLNASGGYSLISSGTYTNLEIGILEAEERSNLTQIQLQTAKLNNSLEDLNFVPGQSISISDLNNLKHRADSIANQLEEINRTLQDKITLLTKRSQIFTQGLNDGTINYTDAKMDLAILGNLIDIYQAQLQNSTELTQQAHTYQTAIARQLNQQIASRHGLPGLDKQAWEILGERLLETPSLLWQGLQNFPKAILVTLQTATANEWTTWIVAISIWLIIWRWLSHYLSIGIKEYEKRKQSVLTSNLFLVCLRLLHRYLLGFMLVGSFFIASSITGIPLQSFFLIISLTLVGLGFSLVIGFAKIILLENTTDESGHDVRLYHRLRWSLTLGGILTAITVTLHQVPVAYVVQDLFDRLFMLFLSVVSFVLLRSWHVVPTLLEPYLQDKQPYLRQLVRWLSFLIPLTVLSNALIGFIGYVALAWNIAAYQGLFLVILTGYIIARGILGELMNFIAAQLIRRMRNGWLWSEAILKPAHRILKIVLLLGSIVFLFKLYGWGSQSWAVLNLKTFFNLRLFAVAGSVITPLSFIKLFIVISILIWAARWTREFTYRWLFARTKDLGLRNSLAIFSQYLIVAIGILVALKVIGISLTALTVVASAFSLGIGLGLRDIANNFVCGILLLIERPVHVGDYVTVNNIDGEVVHIGMRAITLTTDDHQELIVPNALVFSQIFTNWTHRDNIVRTVIMLKLSRVDDPNHVKTIILDVIKSIPKILASPPPNVYLKDMEDVLLQLKIEYYVDMRAIPSRTSVRSQFLLALLERFKAEGIHAPEHSHEVVLISNEKNNF